MVFLFVCDCQLVLGWDVEELAQPCRIEITSGNWYKGFHLSVRATADNLVEEELMTRTIRIDYTKLVNGTDMGPLTNSSENHCE